ncbi:MAG: FkbM family methyltransferase [Pseudomonadota bacterium]
MSDARDNRRTPIAAGIGRSLRTYYGDPARAARMVRLYEEFLSSGGLAFDIGAHVGDRTTAFRWIGARVVTVEPQPAAMRALRLIHGRDPQVTLVAAAVGAQEGQAAMHVNSANPTISTLSDDFIEAADGAGGWEGEVWDRQAVVPIVTLDGLIAEHGEPDFIKIDVEGLEDAVIAGMTAPVPALSFEVTMIQREAGLRALNRLAALGPYRFALSLGETLELDGDVWETPEAMAARIAALPDEANSGDVYARLMGY